MTCRRTDIRDTATISVFSSRTFCINVLVVFKLLCMMLIQIKTISIQPLKFELFKNNIYLDSIPPSLLDICTLCVTNVNFLYILQILCNIFCGLTWILFKHGLHSYRY